jgi:O-antigen/teichoic acid export membrane protein
VVRGFGWTAAILVSVQLSRFVFGVVLVRLLTPHEFGLAAMALVFSTFVLLASDLSLGVGLVQRSQITEEDRSTVFWTSVGIGLALTALGVALSGPLADFYGDPAVEPLFAVLSLSFVVMALGRTHASLLHREMKFRAMALRVIIATVVGGVVGVTVAAMGFGPWALIAQHMAITVVSTGSLWLFASWYPSLTFSRTSLSELGSFGLRYFGSRLADYVSTSFDKLLVGRFLGSSSLGLYAVGYNLILVPIASFITAAVDTLFPALSRLQEERDRLARVWLRANRVVAAAVFPSILGLVIAAPEIVAVLLGSQWKDAVPIVQVLAIAGLFQATSALGATILTATGRTKTLLRFSLAELALVLAAIAIGVQWDILGVAVAYTGAILLSRLLLVWLAARAVSMPLGDFFASLSGVCQATALTALVLGIARSALVETATPPLPTLALLIALGCAVYLPISRWRVPELLSEFRFIRSREAIRPTPG